MDPVPSNSADYDRAIRALAGHLADRWPRRRSSSFRLGGNNFVTPDLVAFVELPNVGVVEVSTGSMFGARLYGVTLNRRPSDLPDPRDACLHSVDELFAYLETIAAAAASSEGADL